MAESDAELWCATCSRLLKDGLLSWPRQQGLSLRLWPPGPWHCLTMYYCQPPPVALPRVQLQAALELPTCASTRPAAAGLSAARAGRPRCLLQTAGMLLALPGGAGRTGAQLAASRELQ